MTLHLYRVSTLDWKTWQNGKAFSSQGILNRLEKSINIIFYYFVIFKQVLSKKKQTKHLKNTEKMEKNTGKVRELFQSGEGGTML